MKSINKILLGILFLTVFNQIIFAQQNDNKLTVVDGKKMSYKTFNIENRKDNDPVLVFEHGLGGGTFDPVLLFLPINISGIQYNRNGIGQSECDSDMASDSQVTEKLHNLLQTLNIKPPYLLVGNSVGGAYIRLFAAKFPDEVCGLVFIDPTDFMLTSKENTEAKEKSESITDYQELSVLLMKTMSENKDFSEGARNDAKRALKSSIPVFFQEYRDLPPLKNIPVTVIISYNKPIELPDEEMNKKLNLGINFKSWWKEYDGIRITHFSDLIRNNDNSMIVLLPKYSHGIHHQNPKMVAKLILENYNNCSKKQ